ncbi:DUF4956 domain-containing protein [Allosalinactinospora lopnorensis]|uniref:DUF4956 domain-containing protein n=1 Tax=Allosalinactinospora lopnorensis TaxID=1352348 RepID=UPI0009E3FDA5|nr:DUF4956 domain-containing protein [Allosalinactinospora lopnorensis]
MSLLLMLALPVNLLSISVLAYAIYFRRHRRADLMFGYIALNIGVFTVSALMMSQEVGLGIAFGLFGVLSIIRLRSDEISQREVGYYFISLALGLVNGIGATMPLAIAASNVLLLATMYVADHPRIATGVERRVLVLDTVHGGEEELRADLQRRLGGRILQSTVSSVDYVRETTTVDVRFRRPAPVSAGPSARESAATVPVPTVSRR